MLVAGRVDLSEVLARLAAERPVFHSEADFQLALGLALWDSDSDLQVRLEVPPPDHAGLRHGAHLDLVAFNQRTEQRTVLELKYTTRSWSGLAKSGVARSEEYRLKNHGAEDIFGYDVVKDIWRVEQVVGGQEGWNGAVVVLTNNPYYWSPPKVDEDTSNAAAFRLREGTELSGERKWGDNTGDGTKKGHTDKFDLRGSYRLAWRDYSTLHDGPSRVRQFRYLLIPVVDE